MNSTHLESNFMHSQSPFSSDNTNFSEHISQWLMRYHPRFPERSHIVRILDGPLPPNWSYHLPLKYPWTDPHDSQSILQGHPRPRCMRHPTPLNLIQQMVWPPALQPYLSKLPYPLGLHHLRLTFLDVDWCEGLTIMCKHRVKTVTQTITQLKMSVRFLLHALQLPFANKIITPLSLP